MDRGEEIDSQYYRQGFFRRMIEHPVQKGLTVGGGMIISLIIGYLIGEGV